MTTKEKFSLKWDNFQDNLNSVFGLLRDDKDFSDVTLACEDGNHVEAHKVILASSSPVFHNLLIKNKHSHPLIYIRGVKIEDLAAILDFLYFGVANVYQDDLDTFLSLAEDLKVKGLHGTGSIKDGNLHTPSKITPDKNPKYQRHHYEMKHDKTKDDAAVLNSEGTSNNEIILADVQGVHNKPNNKVKPFSCLYGDESFLLNGSLKTNLKTLTGMKSFTCSECDKTFNHKGNLKTYKMVHAGERPFVCTQCSRSFTQSGNLRTHQLIHNKHIL